MQQIIDLEHASLHMSCPIVPKEAPLPSLRQLQTSAKDPFYSLTQMMHIGLSHFTGRGLPTIVRGLFPSCHARAPYPHWSRGCLVLPAPDSRVRKVLTCSSGHSSPQIKSQPPLDHHPSSPKQTERLSESGQDNSMIGSYYGIVC